MIVYLASYPRSGNSLLRDIIHAYFKFPTTNVYPGDHKYPARFRYAQNWRSSENIPLKAKWRFWLLWNEWIAIYDRTVPPFTKNVRFLMVGCGKALTPRNRRQLAAEDNVFFVKTHERPYPAYFKGEFVIQPHRHPGPLFRSYANLESGIHAHALELDHYIEGAPQVGSWSDYHLDWNTALERLGKRMIRVDYQFMVTEPLAVAQRIHTLIGLPYDPDGQLRSFEGRQMHDPRMFGFGSNVNWEQAYTLEQLRRLWQLHQSVMQDFGYNEPDYTAVNHP